MKEKTHLVTCRMGHYKVRVLIKENPDGKSCWWAVQGSHTIHFSPGPPFLTGRQVNNVETTDMFTYYGNGTDERPDNVKDMETFLWLLRNK